MNTSKSTLALTLTLLLAVLLIPRAVRAAGPTISNITDQTTAEDTPIGPIAFTVADSDSALDTLTITAVSDNPTLIPNTPAAITLGGSDADRTITLTPAEHQVGTAEITVEVSDGVDAATDTFEIKVTAVNDPPEIDTISNQIIAVNGTTGDLSFDVSDVETAAADLVVTAVSSNPTLVPNDAANIALGGTGGTRTINITPAANTAGSTTITVTVDDLTDQTTTTFDVSVTNTAPTITPIADQAIDEDTDTGALAFTVGDAESDAADLTVTAVADDTTLVPASGIAISGTGADRTITVTPAEDMNGSTTITVTVNDASDTTDETFDLTVTAVNDPPTITAIADVAIDQDTSTAPIAFTIGDIDNNLTDLTVTAVADDTTLVPASGIVINGTGADRTITVTPAAGLDGVTSITITVADPDDSTTESFQLTVNNVNQPPTISAIPDQTTDEDVAKGPINFTIDDDDTAPGDLTVTAVSDNTTLLPNANINLGGTNGSRTITLTPAANRSGTATVTIRVGDGEFTSEESFDLLVEPVNDAPTLDLNGGSNGVNFSTQYYTNGNPAVLASSNLNVDDIDSTTLSSATITITNLLDATAETLAVTLTGTNIASTFSNGTLTLTGEDTLANYAKALKTVTYRNTASFANRTDRVIRFTLNDGDKNSNSATTTVKILDPRLRIDVTPSTQQIASGGTPIFTVRVTNIGNVALSGVDVAVPSGSACETGWVWGNLGIGQQRSYSCALTNITNELTLTFTVSGKDPNNRTVSASDSARVEVENANIQIVKSPPTQLVRKGDTAQFSIFVFNPSEQVNLVEVEISDPLVPDCSRSGDWEHDNLNSSERVDYACELQNVTAAFTNVITVTGKNALTDQIVTDSSVAEVELLDLTADLTVTPQTITDAGGLLTYTLTISNTGTVAANLSGLTTDQFGSLTDAANGSLLSNTCASAPLPQLPENGGSFSCTFSAEPAVSPPEFSVTAQVDGQDVDGTLPISTTATAVTTVEAMPALGLALQAVPSSLDAPGGQVRFNLTLSNNSPSGSITVDTLTDSRLGDLNGRGSCTLPVTLAVQDTYSCTYQTQIFGSIGDIIIHTVSGSGSASSGQPVSTEVQTSITIQNPGIRTALMPVIAANYPPVEDNDLPCNAYPIANNRTYSFLADDENDWYVFDLAATRNVTVQVKNLPVTDSQIAVWTGTCENLTVNVGYNGASQPNTAITITMNALPPGRYYIWVVNSDNRSYSQPYTLRVVVP